MVYYRYHVESTKDFGNAVNVNTFKYTKFSEAFERFTIEVNNKLDDKSFKWSVILYDMQSNNIKCRVDSKDLV